MNKCNEVLRTEIRNSWEVSHMQKVVDTHLNFEYVGWLENKVIALRDQIESAPKAPNSDYAAALRVRCEFIKHINDSGLNINYDDWVQQRLNAAKAD
jgi:hypothetical protein